MKKILITGGAGFVGSHLTQKLLKEDVQVVVFDNLSFGTEENIPKASNVFFYNGDVRNKEDLRNACASVDVIIHLAAIVSVAVCEKYPELCYENNVIGTRNVFEIGKELRIPKIIYASSAAVYGNLESSSITEQDTVEPISEYGKSKLEKERIAQEYSDSINSVGLRFFNIYGPGLSMENAYPSVLVAFFKKIKEGQAVTVFGDGNQTRDFVHVYDIVQALSKSLETAHTGSKIYNVGTGTETSIMTLAEFIKKIDPTVSISLEESRGFDIAKSCSDISIIKNELGFEPTYNILEDLEELLTLYTK
jgi:UDP-glucose 4-epimerase